MFDGASPVWVVKFGRSCSAIVAAFPRGVPCRNGGRRGFASARCYRFTAHRAEMVGLGPSRRSGIYFAIAVLVPPAARARGRRELSRRGSVLAYEFVQLDGRTLAGGGPRSSAVRRSADDEPRRVVDCCRDSAFAFPSSSRDAAQVPGNRLCMAFCARGVRTKTAQRSSAFLPGPSL